MKMTVIKRDGRKEAFSLEKIAQVMKAAGLTKVQTEKVVKKIEKWCAKRHSDTITSLQIRDQLLYILPSINKPVADLFCWYQKTKDKTI